MTFHRLLWKEMAEKKIWTGRSYCGYLCEPRINEVGEIRGYCPLSETKCLDARVMYNCERLKK